MKYNFLKLSLIAAIAVVFTSCEKDDTDFSQYTDPESSTITNIYIAYNGTSATVTGDSEGIVSISGADVVVNSQTADSLVIEVSGSTDDGSLLVYREEARRYRLRLNGVSITNNDGPAINNQCGYKLYLEVVDGTTNTLVDGATYGTAPTDASGTSIDQKGTLFSEGDIEFSGSGSLEVTGNYKNAIASDDYITIPDGITITTHTTSTGSNGFKANDGMVVNGGTLTIDVASDGGRGIRNEGAMIITGGTINITNSGDCVKETTDGVEDVSIPAGIKCDSIFSITGGSLTISCTGKGARAIRVDQGIKVSGGTMDISTTGDCFITTLNSVEDTTSAACIKGDATFIMSGGTVTLNSSGDGGKGINCDSNIEVSGGSFTAKTIGTNNEGKPKAVKSDTGIIVSGGSFIASTKKSWAIDNGVDSDTPSDRITVNGSPTTCSIAKKEVTITYE